jgi:hypothetical protein
MAKALIIITNMPTPIIAIGRIPASAWSHAPVPCEADKGWQAAMAGYRMAVLPGLWVDAKGLTDAKTLSRIIILLKFKSLCENYIFILSNNFTS